MTTQLLFLPTIAFASGVFAPGAQARFYLSGTSTPVTVYTDTDFLVPAASPLVADAAGRFVQIFYNGTSEIRCVITAADDTAIADIDPVGRSNSTGSAADDLSFTPITGNPATDVQAAIAANTAAVLLKAPLASPALTGTPTAPTATVGTDTAQIATMAALQDALDSGTWTPVLSDSAGVEYNSVTESGFYYRSNSVVTAYFQISATTDATTKPTGANTAYISGFPFATGSGMFSAPSPVTWSSATGTPPSTIFASGINSFGSVFDAIGTNCRLYSSHNVTSNGPTQMVFSDLPAAGTSFTLYGLISYVAA